MSYDLTRYAVNAMLGFAVYITIDTVKLGPKFDYFFVLKDAGIFVTSTVLGNAAADTVKRILPMDGTVPGMIMRPAFTAMMYALMYDKILDDNYPGLRNFDNSLIMSGVTDALISNLEVPFFALLNIKMEW